MIRVHIVEVIALIIIFFVTSVVGVVTGGNSLITVPVMLSFGIEPTYSRGNKYVCLNLFEFWRYVAFSGDRHF